MACRLMAPFLFVLFARSPVFCSPVLLPALRAVDNDYLDSNSDYTDNADDIDMDVIQDLTDCIEYQSDAGRYRVRRDASQTACGLYIVAPPDSQVDITFEEFAVDCQGGGLVEVVDGFVHEIGFFPPIEDLREKRRVKQYCGSARPFESFRSTGNALVIQNRLPKSGDTFQVVVKFVTNPRPCNAVVLSTQGSFRLQNYGSRVNCSVLMLFPQRLSLGYFDVASKRWSHNPNTKSADYLEIRGGNNTSLSRTKIFERLTGHGLQSKMLQNVQCNAVIVRLVSSGLFDNFVEVNHEVLTDQHKIGRTPVNACSV